MNHDLFWAYKVGKTLLKRMNLALDTVKALQAHFITAISWTLLHSTSVLNNIAAFRQPV